MFKKILGENPEALTGLSTVSSPNVMTYPNGGGHTVIDRGAYTVITVTQPDGLYLKKDASLDGQQVDYYKGDEVVINGPLFKGSKEPVGLYIQNGREYGKLINPTDLDPESAQGKHYNQENFGDNNGVIGQKKDGSKFLMTYDQFLHKDFPNSDIAWAFQNGPLLVQNGNNPHNPNTARTNYPDKEIQRTAMGFNAQGDLVIIAAKQAVNMSDMGAFLKREGVENGIYLDGANVGYKEKGVDHGHIVNGSTTIHITTQKEKAKFGIN